MLPIKINKHKKIFLALLLFIISGNSYATIFSPSSADKSIEHLGMIFQIGTVTGSAPIWLNTMIGKFNTIILTLAISLVTYVYIVSTINTAQEGTPMGKKYSAIWTPLRSSLGILLLVPTPGTGYSIIQQTILWLILQGIGAADSLWAFIVTNFNTGTSITQLKDQKIKKDGKELANYVLRSAVCSKSCNKYNRNNASIGLYPTSTVTHYDAANNTVNLSRYIHIGQIGNTKFKNICGSYKLTSSASNTDLGSIENIDENTLTNYAKQILAAKESAMINMYYGFVENIADDLIQKTVTPRNNHNMLLSKTEMLGEHYSPAGNISRGIKTYIDYLSKAGLPVQDQSKLGIMQSAAERGWASAGEYYYMLNSAVKISGLWPSAMVPIEPIANTIPFLDDYLIGDDSILDLPQLDKINDYLFHNSAAVTNTAKSLYDAKLYYDNDKDKKWTKKNINISGKNNIANLVESLQQVDDKNNLKKYIDKLNISNWAKPLLYKKDQDPLITLSQLGDDIMSEIESSWKEIIQLSAKEDKNEEIDKTPLTSMITVATAILMALWGFGAALAYYLPIVPYMIFTLGVLGWMLLVIEAVIAAPILALGFVAPSQDDLGKIIPGIMLLINIILRPTLMVVGFLLSALLLKSILSLVHNSMIGAMYSFKENSSSLLSPLVMLFIYAGFVIAVTNKCFALIYILPDKVLRWVGGTGEDTSQATSQVIGEAKGSYDKGSATFGEVTKGITDETNRAGGILSKFSRGASGSGI